MRKYNCSSSARSSLPRILLAVFSILSALQVGVKSLQAQQLPRFPKGSFHESNTREFRLAEGISVFTPISKFPVDLINEDPFSNFESRSAWWIWTAPFTGRCELDLLKEAKREYFSQRTIFVYENVLSGKRVPARMIYRSGGPVPARDGPLNLGSTSFMAQKGETYYLRVVISNANPNVKIRLKLKLVAENNSYIGNWRAADSQDRTKAMGQITLRVNDKGRFTGKIRSTQGVCIIKGLLDENRQASLSLPATATMPQAVLSLDLATQDEARFSLNWDETIIEAPLDSVGLYSPAFPPIMGLRYSLALEPNSGRTGIGALYINPNRSGNIIGVGWGPDGEKLTFNTQIIYRKKPESSRGYQDYISIYAQSQNRQSDLMISAFEERYTLDEDPAKVHYVRQPAAGSSFYPYGLDMNLNIGSAFIPQINAHASYRGFYQIRVVDTTLDEAVSMLETQLRIDNYGKVFFSSQGIEKSFSHDWKRLVVRGKILWDGKLLPLQATLGYESAQPYLKGIVTSPTGTFSVKTTFIE